MIAHVAMAQAPDVGDRNSSTSLQSRFAAVTTWSSERLLQTGGISSGTLQKVLNSIL
ncbi:MAG: hypothetical protein V7K32_14160 [Nostoc sp.]|uniref:hypothetical protein n=1 Tax=Nostoc sp. TaxID=1180 RepID=UPI002FF9D6E3